MVWRNIRVTKLGIDKDMLDALNPEEVAKVIEFLLSTSQDVLIPEIGIKNITN